MTQPQIDAQSLVNALEDQRNAANSEAAQWKAAYLTEAKAHEQTLEEISALKAQIKELEMQVSDRGMANPNLVDPVKGVNAGLIDGADAGPLDYKD